jgi:hypothetical protein
VAQIATLMGTIAFGAVMSACAASHSRGAERRPDPEAILETDGTVLQMLDGKSLGTTAEVTLSPGRHSIGVTLADRQDYLIAAVTYTSRVPLILCFQARPGRTYRVRPAFIAHGRWEPEIIDTTNQTVVKRAACPGGE